MLEGLLMLLLLVVLFFLVLVAIYIWMDRQYKKELRRQKRAAIMRTLKKLEGNNETSN